MRVNILRIEIYNGNISKFGILQICDIRYERRNLENAVHVRARTEQVEFYEGGICVSARAETAFAAYRLRCGNSAVRSGIPNR